MNFNLVWASEKGSLMEDLSVIDQQKGLLNALQGSDINMILLGGLGIVVIALISFLVIPRFLDRTLGLIALVGMLILGSVAAISLPRLTAQPTLFQARQEGQPEQIQVYNIQPTEFIISWKTSQPVTGAVVYGLDPNNMDKVAVELDPTKVRKDHLVRVIDLQPGSTYYLKIVSGGKEYLKDGMPVEVNLPR